MNYLRMLRNLFERLFQCRHYVVVNVDSNILPTHKAEIRVYLDARPSIPHYTLVYNGHHYAISLVHFPDVHILQKTSVPIEKKLAEVAKLQSIEPQVTAFLKTNMPRIRARYNYFEFCCHLWDTLNPKHKI